MADAARLYDKADYTSAGDASQCLRPEEAARHLGISRAKVYELIAAGELSSISIGRARRVPLVAIRQFVDRRLGSM